MAVSLYYWNDMPNFGDRLNEDVCRFFSGDDPVWASPKRCGAVFIGSVLEKFIYGRKRWTVDALWIKYGRTKVSVWGSGFIRPSAGTDERLTRRLDVRAVRGMRTLERLRNLTGLTLENVAVGDPGLLASKIFNVGLRAVRPCGIIPHHAELARVPRDAATVSLETECGVLQRSTVKSMPAFARLADMIPGAVVLNPESAPAVAIGLIGECAAVLSSAMHGLIVADSFGIPNARVVASDDLMGGDYKFRDYYSVFKKDRHRVFDIRGALSPAVLETMKNGYDNPQPEVCEIQRRLVAAYPASSGCNGSFNLDTTRNSANARNKNPCPVG